MMILDSGLLFWAIVYNLNFPSAVYEISPFEIESDPPQKKKLAHYVLYALTSSNINRFSKLFHCQNQENISNNNVSEDPTTHQICRYTTL